MKPKNIKYLLILMFLLLSQATYAVYGCFLSSDNKVYTDLNNAETKWKKNSGVFVGSGACVDVDEGSCVVNYSPNRVGVLGDFDVSYCPLDDYTWVLFISISGLVFVKPFSKKVLFNS